MYSLKDLEREIQFYANQNNKLPRGKRAVIKLTKDIKMLDLCVLSNVSVGLTLSHSRTADQEKPFRLNKFKAHIDELAKNPNARIMLGGDLFYFPAGPTKYREEYSPNYLEQIDMMAELLQPIKDKIIGAYDGTDEIKIFTKDGLNMTSLLMKKLGYPERYLGQMAELEVLFNNEYTNNTTRPVHILFDHGFLAANVTNTVSKKTQGLQNKIDGKDFYISSHYNKVLIEKRSVLATENSSNLVKKPCYFISVGGYRDYPNKLASNRNTSPSSTNNGIIRIFVAPNPDRNNIRGNNYLGEPQYKVCQEFVNFGSSLSSLVDFDLSEEISKITQSNILAKTQIAKMIEDRINNINKDSIENILTKYYAEQDKIEREKARKTKKQVKDVVEVVTIYEK